MPKTGSICNAGGPGIPCWEDNPAGPGGDAMAEDCIGSSGVLAEDWAVGRSTDARGGSNTGTVDWISWGWEGGSDWGGTFEPGRRS